MKAVILAAGKGERLRPLTDTRPKHVLPIGGMPLLKWSLKGLAENGIENVLIVTHFMEDHIKASIGNGTDLNLSISYAHQKEMKGTANAFSMAKSFVGNEEFIGFYGDGFITTETFQSVLNSHKKDETTIGVVKVEDPSNFAAVELDKNRVLRIVEKPLTGKSPSNLANTGIYVFTPEIFDYIKKTSISSRGEFEITDSISSLIENGNPVNATILSHDGWMDVGQPWDLLEANKRALQYLTKINTGELEKGVSFIGPIHVEKGARIRTGTYIEGPVYIGPNCDIGPNCYIRPYTSIGEKVRIGNACEIKNSIIMYETHIAHLSYIGDSIIGARCNLGAGTITANIRFDKKNVYMKIKENRLDSGRRKLGIIMGDNSQTGINVGLLPGRKIGSQVWIAPGLTVNTDVPSESFLKKEGCFLRKDTEEK